MYKTRLEIWGIVLVFFVSISLIFNTIEHKKEASHGIKNVTICSDNTYLSRIIDNTKLSNGIKLNAGQNYWDLYLSENMPLTNENYEEYYSPIVALIHTNIYNTSICSNPSRGVYALDLKKTLDGFMNNKKYSDIFKNAVKKEIKIYADINYEKEIKQVILIAISGKKEPTIDDYNNYYDEVIKIWDKIEKVNNIDTFTSTEENYIFLAPEYLHITNKNVLKIASLINTTDVKFYLSYKNEYEFIARENSFMKKSGLRRSSFSGTYKKGNLKYTDWSIYISNCFDWNVVNKKEELLDNNTETNNKTITNDNKKSEESKQKDDTNKSSADISSDAEWEIYKKKQSVDD